MAVASIAPLGLLGPTAEPGRTHAPARRQNHIRETLVDRLRVHADAAVADSSPARRRVRPRTAEPG